VACVALDLETFLLENFTEFAVGCDQFLVRAADLEVELMMSTLCLESTSRYSGPLLAV
jgi:hypothetical protein